MKRVFPSSCSTSQSCLLDIGSSPVVGSSRNIISASEAVTVAISTLRLVPPDRRVFRVLAYFCSPSLAKASDASLFACLYGKPRQSRYENTVCFGVIQRMVRASWGTIAIFSRSLLVCVRMSWLFMDAVPEVGSSSVARMRTKVVFPAPFLPIKLKMPLVSIEKLTLSSAFL